MGPTGRVYEQRQGEGARGVGRWTSVFSLKQEAASAAESKGGEEVLGVGRDGRLNWEQDKGVAPGGVPGNIQGHSRSVVTNVK